MFLNDPEIKGLNFKQKMFLYALIALGLTALYASFMPFLAERNYREGFNLNLMRRHSEAVTYLEKAMHYAPLETHYQIELAKAYEQSTHQENTSKNKVKLLKKAESIVLNAMKIDPINPWYLNRLANIYRNLDKVDPQKTINYQSKITNLLEKAAKNDSNNPLFQLNLAYYYHQIGMKDAALNYYKRALSIDRGFDVARFNMANIYQERGKNQLALDEYLAIYERNPQFTNLITAMSQLYIQMKDYVNAIKYLKEGQILDPSNQAILQSLASLYYTIESYPNAENTFDKLFRRHPKDKKTYYEAYIKSLLRQGKVEKSQYFIQQYIQQFPNDSRAQKQHQILDTFLKGAQP